MNKKQQEQNKTKKQTKNQNNKKTNKNKNKQKQLTKQMMNNYLKLIRKKTIFATLPFSKAHLSWSLGRAVAQCTVGPDPGPAWFPFSIGQWAAVPLKRCLILEPAVVCCRPEHGVLISIIVLLLKPGSVASQGQMVPTQA